MKKVLVLVFADLTYDARVIRQIDWLRESHDLTVVCFKGLRTRKDVRFIELKQQDLSLIRKLLLALALLFRFYKMAYIIQHGYYKKLESLKAKSFDFIVANDVETLPLAFKLQGKAKIIFDAHEYAPRHFEDKLWWKILFAPWYTHICRVGIPRVSAMTTVCDGLALEYEKQFHTKPHVITNATKYHNLLPSEVSTPVRLVHHGIFNKSRKISLMVEVMKELGPEYSLDFILMLPEYASASTMAHFEDFKEQVESQSNISILPALPSHELVPAINIYDMGIFLLEPVNFNYTHALPNKLFDFVQARLSIAIGPSPEMQRIVEQHKLGVISTSFDPKALAASIKSLSKEDIRKAKLNSDAVARELSEETNKHAFLKLLDSKN